MSTHHKHSIGTWCFLFAFATVFVYPLNHRTTIGSIPIKGKIQPTLIAIITPRTTFPLRGGGNRSHQYASCNIRLGIGEHSETLSRSSHEPHPKFTTTRSSHEPSRQLFSGATGQSSADDKAETNHFYHPPQLLVFGLRANKKINVLHSRGEWKNLERLF